MLSWSWSERLLTSTDRILGELGEGSYGKVLRICDIKTRRVFAVKVTAKGVDFWNQARQEARILETIRLNDTRHANHCIYLKRVYEVGGSICIQTPLFGKSVQNTLMRLPFRRLRHRHLQTMGHQLLEALAYSHNLGIIHTDVKPDNIVNTKPSLLSNHEEPDIHLIDFGCAVFARDSNDRHDVVTTAPYRAPEVCLGLHWDSPIDLFSVGCIFAELYTGVRLFHAGDDDANDDLQRLAEHQAVSGQLGSRVCREVYKKREIRSR